MKHLIPFKRFLAFSPVFFILFFIYSTISTASLDTGFDPKKTPAWSRGQAEATPDDNSDQTSPYEKPIYGPTSPLAPLDHYQSSRQEDPFSIAQKIDEMISGLSSNVSAMASQPSITGDGAPRGMMDQAGIFANDAQAVYRNIHSMYSEISSMEQALDSNTQSLKGKMITQADANDFNASTTAMSERVGAMRQSLTPMKDQITADKDIVDSMPSTLDEMASEGADTKQYYDQLGQHIKEVSNRFESMNNDLKAQGSESDDAASQVRQYLTSLKEYVKAHKPFTAQELDYISQVKEYLGKISDYLGQTLSAIDKTDQNLSAIQQFFIDSKAHPGKGGLQPPGQGAPDVCSGLVSDDTTANKGSPLMSSASCQASCHTTCRQEKKAGGTNCYACASGFLDTCNSVIGAVNPDECKAPSGSCYKDPNSYCESFTVQEKTMGWGMGNAVTCFRCKSEPDECAAKVGGGSMDRMSCSHTCHGTCMYQGKYQFAENPDKYSYCYTCSLPAPTCENLGWGSTTLQMCMKNCADGQCQQVKVTMGKDGQGYTGNPPNGGDNGGQNGGQNGGGAQNGGQNGTPAPGGDQPGGNGQGGGDQNGGGVVAGGNQGGAPAANGGGQPQGGPSTPAGPGQSTGGTSVNKPEDKGSVDQPAKPASNEAKDPGAPNTQNQPTAPSDPNAPTPDTWNVNFYNNWLNGVKERIKKYEDIVNDPNEAQGVKDIAKKDLEDMYKDKEALEAKVKAAQSNVDAQQQEIDARNKLISDYEKNRPATVDYAKEAERRGLEWKAKELKKATDALINKLQEAKDAINARKEQIDKITKEIDLLNRENNNLKQGLIDGGLEGDFVESKTEQNNKRIAELTGNRNELIKGLNKAVSKYNEEINQLKSEYLTAFFRLNENVRRSVEVQRMVEYKEKYDEYKRALKAKEIRDKAFDDTRGNLQGQEARLRAAGDNSSADDIHRQIDNLNRGQQQWDEQQDKRIAHLDDDLYRTGQRNFNEGAGPYSPKNLGEKYNTYIGYVDKNIGDVQKALANGTITQDQANKMLDDLKSVQDGFINEQKDYNNQNPYSDEDTQRIAQDAMKIVNAAMGTDADKSFARLFGESLLEEMVHNTNPLVLIRKGLAFRQGFKEGFVEAFKDVAKIGYNIAKTLAQATAVDLGFENGGIFGTDNLDALASLGSTINSNTNFDGALAGLMAIGKAEVDLLNELGKGDIDTNTAKFGGKVAGNIVGSEAAGVVVSKAFGVAYDAAKGALKGGEAIEGGKAVEKATELAKGTEGIGAVEKPTVKTSTPVETHGPPEGQVGEVTEEKPATSSEEKPATTSEEKPAKEYDNTKTLPDTGVTPKSLDDATLTKLENENGFKKEHAQRMNNFAQKKGVYLIVRDGNPDSVKFFDDPDMLAKPMTSKAKTAKVGPNKGIVVDPVHPVQAAEWDKAIAAAEQSGDKAKLGKLIEGRNRALKAWKDYGADMLSHGYQVNPETGVIEYVEKNADGTIKKVWRGVHGDYDLHGVYKVNPDGTISHVSFGPGDKLDINHFDTEGTVVRKQLNDAITGGEKDLIQHGGQDDWIPDPSKVPNKPPDPPATVFFPNGRPPITLHDAQEMKDFYEKVMGVQFPYSDEAVANSMKATNAAKGQ